MTRKVFLKAMVAVVVVFGLLVFPSDLAAQGNRGAAFNRVQEVQARHTDALLAIKDVVGTAIGLGQGGQPVLLVLLANGGVAIPNSLDGVQVRPLLTGAFYAYGKPIDGVHNPPHGDDPPDDDPVDPTARFERPVPIGVSTGNEEECFAGTMQGH